MKCPHCRVEIYSSFDHLGQGHDDDTKWVIYKQNCPACHRTIIMMMQYAEDGEEAEILLYPHTATRPAPPTEVPKEFAQDYIEAALVLADSPKASAALSRRCLQHVLREKAGVKRQDLAKEIQQVLDDGKLPSYLADDIDAIRNIGNFAAHPIKSTASGEVQDVEPGEAEWNLDVLDGLFDFYFVQPALAASRRAALDAKLHGVGKPPIK